MGGDCPARPWPEVTWCCTKANGPSGAPNQGWGVGDSGVESDSFFRNSQLISSLFLSLQLLGHDFCGLIMILRYECRGWVSLAFSC